MAGRGDNSKAKPGAPVDVEPLRRAITGCVRAIAGDGEVEVTFANERPGMPASACACRSFPSGRRRTSSR
jgi:cobaltochelatase CobT